jgi:hypothetical protein
LPALEHLKQGSDWRLQDGADGLIRLIGSANGRPAEPENSIFNPANPQYILKGGCGRPIIGPLAQPSWSQSY